MDMNKAIVRRGDTGRLAAVMARAARGESVCVGFLGGSITQGSLASDISRCYASLVADWWRKSFPAAAIRDVNAGIGGTTSQFGAARAGEDLLNLKPDVVFIEFSVNDENTPHFRETYEGLVRRAYKTGAAVVLLHNVRYDDGSSAEDVHREVGAHYDLPSVSLRALLWPEVEAGRIPARDVTPDDLHPNDRGHAIVAAAVTALLDQVRGEAGAPEGGEKPLPPPLTENAYENSVRYRNDNAEPELCGFVPDHTPQEHITQMFRRGYTAGRAGDAIRFTVEGTCLAVQYRKSVKKPAPIARAVVDGDEEHAVLLDANFDEDWGDCLYLQDLLVHGADGPHTVDITLTETHEDDTVPFYLVSVIASR